MKKLTVLILGLSAALPMQAQLFTPESLTGAALGGLTGAIIGHHSGRHGGEGAAIGAGAGLLLGSLAYHSRRERDYSYYSPSYSYSAGYDYHYPVLPTVYYSAPAYTVVQNQATPQPAGREVAPAPQRNTFINNRSQPPSAMSSANRLFGR